MKKILTPLFFLVFGICSSQNFDAGIIAGITSSQISGDNLAGFNKLGAQIGAYINYPLNKTKNLQLGIQYIQKGSKKPYSENSTETYIFDLHYIEVPLTMNYRIRELIHLEAGLASGYLFTYKEQDEIGELNREKPYSLSLDLVIGVQYQIKKNIKSNLRYAHSITPIRKHSSEGVFVTNRGQTSSMLSFTLMYKISK